MPPYRTVPILLTAALLASCAAFRTAAAVVNGRTIDDERFRRSLDYFAADPRFAMQFPGEQAETEKKTLARQLLTFLIHQQLIQEYADERGVLAAEAEVDKRLEERVVQQGGDEAFRAQLEEAGATRGDVRELIRAQVLREYVARVVVAEEVPDESLRSEYESRLTEFTQVHTAHILVNDEAQAERLLARATPKSFAALARRFSTDPGSKDQGGDLGTRPASEFVAPFDKATIEIPVGEIGGPVQTEFGFHVVYVIERNQRPFEEVREQILGEIGEEFFSRWLLDRVRGAEILVNPRYGALDEGNGEVVERRATTPEPEPQLTP